MTKISSIQQILWMGLAKAGPAFSRARSFMIDRRRHSAQQPGCAAGRTSSRKTRTVAVGPPQPSQRLLDGHPGLRLCPQFVHRACSVQSQHIGLCQRRLHTSNWLFPRLAEKKWPPRPATRACAVSRSMSSQAKRRSGRAERKTSRCWRLSAEQLRTRFRCCRSSRTSCCSHPPDAGAIGEGYFSSLLEHVAQAVVSTCPPSGCRRASPLLADDAFASPVSHSLRTRTPVARPTTTRRCWSGCWPACRRR